MSAEGASFKGRIQGHATPWNCLDFKSLKSPFLLVYESLRQDIGQILTCKVLSLKIDLFMKNLLIFVKRWKPVWIRACFTRTLAMLLTEGTLVFLLFTKSSTKESLKSSPKVSSKQAVGYWVSCRAKQRHNACERVGCRWDDFVVPRYRF